MLSNRKWENDIVNLREEGQELYYAIDGYCPQGGVRSIFLDFLALRKFFPWREPLFIDKDKVEWQSIEQYVFVKGTSRHAPRLEPNLLEHVQTFKDWTALKNFLERVYGEKITKNQIMLEQVTPEKALIYDIQSVVLDSPIFDCFDYKTAFLDALTYTIEQNADLMEALDAFFEKAGRAIIVVQDSEPSKDLDLFFGRNAQKSNLLGCMLMELNIHLRLGPNEKYDVNFCYALGSRFDVYPKEAYKRFRVFSVEKEEDKLAGVRENIFLAIQDYLDAKATSAGILQSIRGLFSSPDKRGKNRANALQKRIQSAKTLSELYRILFEHFSRKESYRIHDASGRLKPHSLDTYILCALEAACCSGVDDMPGKEVLCDNKFSLLDKRTSFIEGYKLSLIKKEATDASYYYNHNSKLW